MIYSTLLQYHSDLLHCITTNRYKNTQVRYRAIYSWQRIHYYRQNARKFYLINQGPFQHHSFHGWGSCHKLIKKIRSYKKAITSMESGSLHQETFRLKLGRDGVPPQKGRDCICTNRLELRPMIGPLEERKITALNILPIDFSRHIFWR